ncbi:MAG: glycosyltransferase, partial [Burkholderiales bacterium]|nr:glycosyltransferase [Burkholderiales bacterium]
IQNGYDEESFEQAESALRERTPLEPGCAILLHSGIVYPAERDPTGLMKALQQLSQRGVLRPGRLKVRFRASAHDALITDLAQQHGVLPYVELLPPVGYREALAEMLRADALLVMQAANCNDQVPAKVYEYLRSGRPIVSLAEPAGDTAGLLRESGVESVALDDAVAIAQRIEAWLAGRAERLLPSPQSVAAASRRARSAELAREFDSIADARIATARSVA